jgi:YD repeat-containing protein
VVNPDGYSWSIRPYLADGIAGELRLPSHGRIGAQSIELAGLAEARARYVDPRGNVWEYQTDRYGLLIAEAKPAVPGSPQRDVWQWVRDDRGLPLRTIVPPGGGGDTPLPAITTRQEYDAAGDLLKRIFADGTYEQWTYDPVFHQVRSYRDRLGRRT